jgi:hypothetical protein
MLKRAMVLALAFASPGFAVAATLYAGPVTTYADNSRCLATNVSTKTIELTLTLVAFNGIDADSATCPSVGPGQSCFVDNATGNTCRIEFKGSKNAVRGTLEVSQDNAVVATSPAR